MTNANIKTADDCKTNHEKLMTDIYSDLTLNNPNDLKFSDDAELTAFIQDRLKGLEGYLTSETKDFHEIIKQMVGERKLSIKDANFLLNWYTLSTTTVNQKQMEVIYDIIKANSSYDTALSIKSFENTKKEFQRVHESYLQRIINMQKRHFIEVMACLVCVILLTLTYLLSTV